MSKYVLLIEDDPSLQKAYQMKFETKGIAARVVGDGKEMIQLLNQKHHGIARCGYPRPATSLCIGI